jgi:hypothetical protein
MGVSPMPHRRDADATGSAQWGAQPHAIALAGSPKALTFMPILVIFALLAVRNLS